MHTVLFKTARCALAAAGLALAVNGLAAEPAAAPATIAVPLDEIGTYTREAYRRELTDCDRLAAHYDDPERVGEGVGRSAMDKPAAIAACRRAVAEDPENPRLQYQLGRAYGYSGRHAEAIPHREDALRAGYPQSLFVMGYIRTTGWDGAPPDPCYGGELILRSARLGRMAGLLGFPHYAQLGYFDDCTDYPRYTDADLLALLDQAEADTRDFYKLALIAQLRRSIEADAAAD
jgi:tetratricopeptide (TPR) repeat protein